MKITKQRLKEIIGEELTAVEKGKKADLEKELTGIAGSRGISKTMNKGAKDKIEKELDDLKHKWMKEAKLSSALMERYGISKKNAVGTVIWHSLNENAEIGVYDIKFGNTIVRNLSEADVKAVVAEEHGHDKRDDDDPNRK